MAKSSLSFVCQNCGAAYNRWQGKCEACGEWNTLAEEDSATSVPVSIRSKRKGRQFALESLSGKSQDAPRLSSGMAELDRVTGGGFVRGSVLLVGGDPGIGKSTLLTQATALLARDAIADFVRCVSTSATPRQPSTGYTRSITASSHGSHGVLFT